MDKTLKIIVYYGVKERTVYVDGINVGDMIEDIEIGFSELLRIALTGKFSKLKVFNISIYQNNVDFVLNDYEYEVVMQWLSGADKISEQQQIYIINEEWDKLFKTLE